MTLKCIEEVLKRFGVITEECGDRAATELVTRIDRYANDLVKQYRVPEDERDQLLFLGLAEAASSWNPCKNPKFENWAYSGMKFALVGNVEKNLLVSEETIEISRTHTPEALATLNLSDIAIEYLEEFPICLSKAAVDKFNWFLKWYLYDIRLYKVKNQTKFPATIRLHKGKLFIKATCRMFVDMVPIIDEVLPEVEKHVAGNQRIDDAEKHMMKAVGLDREPLAAAENEESKETRCNRLAYRLVNSIKDPKTRLAVKYVHGLHGNEEQNPLDNAIMQNLTPSRIHQLVEKGLEEMRNIAADELSKYGIAFLEA